MSFPSSMRVGRPTATTRESNKNTIQRAVPTRACTWSFHKYNRILNSVRHERTTKETKASWARSCKVQISSIEGHSGGRRTQCAGKCEPFDFICNSPTKGIPLHLSLSPSLPLYFFFRPRCAPTCFIPKKYIFLNLYTNYNIVLK